MKDHAVVALMILAALSSGCGKSEKSFKGAERATPNSAETKSAETKNAETKSAETKNAEAKSADAKSAALPDNFPRDLPILRDATLKLAMSQGDRMVVHLHTSRSISDAAKFYRAELASRGWKIQSTSSSAEMFIVSAKKGKTLCGVTIAKQAKGTLIRLAVSQDGS
ncbi:MAG TPA: hypothetical protein VFF44_08070 [Casimicrobiaceae bacterium]|nr:hypothetical protein [Casimicrobiaceae bacterium]